jgi:thioesterase domain-containing protein
MKIAQIAPLFESVPPRLYGGTERIVSYLTEELVSMGHDVTLFASGDSLTAVEVVLQLQQTLSIELPFVSFIDTPTVADMAERVASLQAAGMGPGQRPAFSFLVELQRGKAGKPIFVVPGGGGQDSEFFYFMRLVRHMRPDYRCYGFRVRGADGFTQPHSSVEEMAKDYIAEMQTLQPEGPYFLVGDCIGGAVAHEAARQLRAKGQAIATLILLDSQSPTTLKYFAYRLGRLKEDALARLVRHSKTVWKRLRQIPQETHPSYQAAPSTSDLIERSQNAINPAVHIHKVAEVYTRNVRRHKPKPYDGEIKLVVNAKWYQRNATLGWGQLASGGVESYAAAGDHFTYIDRGPHAESVAGQLRKWIDEARGADGNERLCEQGKVPDASESPLFLTERLTNAKDDLTRIIPFGDSFILVDGCEWGADFVTGRRAIPFLEREGQYAGCPADDETAIRELERLRQAGANFIVFGWPAFWWLDYYTNFARYLTTTTRKIFSDDCLIAFDLTGATQ